MDDDAATVAGPDVTRVGSAFDPRVSLATSVYSSPGVYALLLGSGVSIGAGIKTGWGIVQDLVRQAATAADPADAGAGAAAAEDPEGWWEEHGEGPLGYSGLLAELATTAAARQNILKSYFEPQPDATGEMAAISPGAAHRAVAQLVLRGSVRVILTTNFDRLIERALEEVGISPQVIHSPAQFDAATPLCHSKCTVIKLHGDYLDLHLRNTVDELEEYPSEQQQFLARVLDEHGLIVCGWSADWDHALARAVEGTRSRRYPMYWSHLGPLGEAARKLTAQHKATPIPEMTADEFFPDLVHRLEALDRMSELPISRDMAVARLKRALPDPVRRIELSDLIDEAVGKVVALANQQRYPLGNTSYEDSVRGYRADSDTLLHLLATGVFHDNGTHDRHWVKALQRLSRIRSPFTGGFNEALEQLRHYPALLGTWTAGAAAVLAQREDLLYRLLTEPTWISPWTARKVLPAANYLAPVQVLNGDLVSKFCHPANGHWKYPQSRLVRDDAREPLRAVEPDDATYEAACDRLEFLASMIALDNTTKLNMPFPWHGEFFIHNFSELAEQIKDEIAPGWQLLEAGGFGGDVDRAKTACAAVLAWLLQHPVF